MIKKIAPMVLIILVILAAVLLVIWKFINLSEKTNLALKDAGESSEELISGFFLPNLPENSLEVITDKNSYKVGEEIFFGVQNKTEETFKIENECPNEPLEIYKLENDKWRHLKVSSYIQCKNNDNIILAPYELRGASFLPWEKLIFDQPGKYKLKLKIIGYATKFEKEIEIVE
ncbi:hypothetical protein HZC33_03140 [Candidatus Wolfebacteria bacterium]|nr:hypothetical protein [Candidatus Wolfebacteria bacterium]